MRIISQNEKLDLPYENIVVEIMDSVIVAYTPMTNPLRMAQYKSQEKAEKAMQKLYDDYDLSKRFEALGYKAIQNLISWNGRKETEKFLYENIFSFRFPQDDEF